MSVTFRARGVSSYYNVQMANYSARCLLVLLGRSPRGDLVSSMPCSELGPKLGAIEPEAIRAVVLDPARIGYPASEVCADVEGSVRWLVTRVEALCKLVSEAEKAQTERVRWD